MSPISSFFISYCFYLSNKKVQTTDGAYLTIAKIRKIKLDSIGILENVLHVPKLCLSSISIHRLAKTPEIYVIFDEDDTLMLNKVSQRKIRLAKLR